MFACYIFHFSKQSNEPQDTLDESHLHPSIVAKSIIDLLDAEPATGVRTISTGLVSVPTVNKTQTSTLPSDSPIRVAFAWKRKLTAVRMYVYV